MVGRVMRSPDQLGARCRCSVYCLTIITVIKFDTAYVIEPGGPFILIGATGEEKKAGLGRRDGLELEQSPVGGALNVGTRDAGELLSIWAEEASRQIRAPRRNLRFDPCRATQVLT